MLRILPRMTSKTRTTSGLVFARRVAAAVVAGDGSRWQQADNKNKDERLLTRHSVKLVRMWSGRLVMVLSRAARNRRNANDKSSLLELARLLSARSPVRPAGFLTHQK